MAKVADIASCAILENPFMSIEELSRDMVSNLIFQKLICRDLYVPSNCRWNDPGPS